MVRYARAEDISQLLLPMDEEGPSDLRGTLEAGLVPGSNGNPARTWERQLEELLEIESTNRYIIVVLGKNPRTMRRIADYMRSGLHDRHSQEQFSVLLAADFAHALALYKEADYHPVAAIVADPNDNEGNQIPNILNLLDEHRMTDFSRKPLFDADKVDEAAISREVDLTIDHYRAVTAQVVGKHSQSGDVLPSGLLPWRRIVEQYNPNLERLIMEKGEGSLRDAWEKRRREEEVNVKKIIPASSASQPRFSIIPAEELEAAVNAVKDYAYPALTTPDYASGIGPEDKRKVPADLGKQIDLILTAGNPDLVEHATHFLPHATTGTFGLFPRNTKAQPPNRKFIFVKPGQKSNGVEDAFRKYSDLAVRGFRIHQEPLAYHYSEHDGTYAIVSQSPLLAITAHVAQEVRKLGSSWFEMYQDALMEADMRAMSEYNSAVATQFDERDMVSVLHKYKTTYVLGIKELEMTKGVQLTDLEWQGVYEFLKIFDDVTLWPKNLFGPIIDNKTSNHGNIIGSIAPSPVEIQMALFGDSRTPDRDILAKNMQATFGFLEHEGRFGLRPEDMLHTLNSPDFYISPERRPYHMARFGRDIMPQADADDAALSTLWLPIFATQQYKAVRKEQMTTHYMIMNNTLVRDPDEMRSNNRQYLEEARYYSQLGQNSALAAALFFSNYSSAQFDEQVKGASDLYGRTILPGQVKLADLHPFGRSFFLAYMALDRLMSASPNESVLRTMRVSH